MPCRVCLFGDLDPFTGTYLQTIETIKPLLQDLKSACLMYDNVVVNRNVFFEHALTLPAFENLSLFTKSGILWTISANDNAPPTKHVLIQAQELYGKQLNKGISKQGTEKILQIIERWQAISPTHWQFSSMTTQQQSQATENIITNLQNLPNLSKQAKSARRQLIELSMLMQQQNVFNRNQIMARIGAMRELLAANELLQFALIIEGGYLNLQVTNKGGILIILYPGKFAQYLRKHYPAFQTQPLMTDVNTFDRIQYWLLQSGFPLDQLSNFQSEDVYYLSQLSEWKQWRHYLASEKVSFESIKEIKALKKTKKTLLEILPILVKNIDCVDASKTNPLPTLLIPDAWYVSGVGLFGDLAVRENDAIASLVNIDLSTKKLKYLSKIIVLDNFGMTLFSLMASICNQGISIEIIKQLDIELDLLKRHYSNPWHSQSTASTEQDVARLNRINVSKNRLQKKLKKIGLAITVQYGHGIWQLVCITNYQPVTLQVKETTCTPTHSAILNQSVSEPEGLTATQKKLWEFLKLRYGSFVSSKAIALEIDNPTASNKQISDTIYKLKKRLRNTAYVIIRNYHGSYCLMHIENKKQEA
jgi:hypothetical protein